MSDVAEMNSQAWAVVSPVRIFVITIALALSACDGTEKETTGAVGSVAEMAAGSADAPRKVPASVSRTPEMESTDAARRWLDQMNAGNLAAAMEGTVGAMKQMIGIEAEKSSPAPFPEHKILRTEMVDDELARVIISTKNAEDESVLYLVKLGGKWLTSVEEPEVEAIRVTKKWLDSLNDGNVTAAQEISTDNTKRLMGLLGVTIVPREYRIHEVEMVRANLVKVTSYVEFIDKNTVFDVQQSGGKWKVELNSDDWW